MGLFDYDKDDRSIYHMDLNNDGRMDYSDDCIYEDTFMNAPDTCSDDEDDELEDLEFMSRKERKKAVEDMGFDIDVDVDDFDDADTDDFDTDDFDADDIDTDDYD